MIGAQTKGVGILMATKDEGTSKSYKILDENYDLEIDSLIAIIQDLNNRIVKLEKERDEKIRKK